MRKSCNIGKKHNTLYLLEFNKLINKNSTCEAFDKYTDNTPKAMFSY